MALDSVPAACAVRIGVAGWDYPDWDGIVYPAGRPGRFDRLRYLARYVQLIEVNSTFYRPVAAPVAASWVRRTADLEGFRFTAKAHRSWSHDGSPDLDRVVPETLRGLEPLREAGRLGALLVQFPHAFRCEPTALDRIARLADRCRGWPVAVEVRHASWEADDAERWFRDREIAWCVIDQPRVDRSSLGLLRRVTAPFAYVRLHGRNCKAWFDPAAGRDRRYDYRYGARGIGDLAPDVREIARSARALYAVQNNHFRGQALADSLQMRAAVEGVRPLAPPELVTAYPDLADHVTLEQDRLF